MSLVQFQSEEFGGFMEGKHAAGKGDSYRPVNYKKWSENWDKIFKKKVRKEKKK